MALQEAVKQAPENAPSRRFLGRALEALGKLEAAAGEYRRTLAMAGGDAELQAKVRSLEAKLASGSAEGDGTEAAQAAAEDGTTAGGEAPPFSSSTLAELYLRQGFTAQAVEVYRQVVAERPGEERARARLAELVSLLPGRRVEESCEDGGEQERRRRALQRTIAGLELLLGMARRR